MVDDFKLAYLVVLLVVDILVVDTALFFILLEGIFTLFELYVLNKLVFVPVNGL